MKTRTIRLAVVAFAAACALALAACGGGGSTPDQTAGTWDQMKWDEKNWQ